MSRRRAFLVVTACAALLASLFVFPAAAAPDYYNNSSGVVDSDSPRNATFQNIVETLVELSPTVIGTGDRDPSGTGFQGVLLTGLVWAGVSIGAMRGAGVGSISGSILGSIVAYGLVDAGFAPAWIKPLLLFGIGTLAFVMFKRVFR